MRTESNVPGAAVPDLQEKKKARTWGITLPGRPPKSRLS